MADHAFGKSPSMARIKVTHISLNFASSLNIRVCLSRCIEKEMHRVRFTNLASLLRTESIVPEAVDLFHSRCYMFVTQDLFVMYHKFFPEVMS